MTVTLPANTKMITLLSGFGVTKESGILTLENGEEYVSHRIEQEPPDARYTVVYKLLDGKTGRKDEEKNANNYCAKGAVKATAGPASIALSLEKGSDKSKTSLSTFETTKRIIELSVSGGTGSCCGFGKVSSFKLYVYTTKNSPL